MSIKKLSAEERETVIILNDGDKFARVHTWQLRLQKRLQANPDARLIKQGIHQHPDDRWIEFEVPKELVTIRLRRVISAEQREKAASHLRALKSGRVPA